MPKFGSKKSPMISNAATQKLHIKLYTKSDIRGQIKTNPKATRLNY